MACFSCSPTGNLPTIVIGLASIALLAKIVLVLVIMIVIYIHPGRSIVVVIEIIGHSHYLDNDNGSDDAAHYPVAGIGGIEIDSPADIKAIQLHEVTVQLLT